MEKISRKGFLKIAAAAAMSGVTAGALAACESASQAASGAASAASPAAGAVYIPGTYEGTAEGISSTVKVTMTFSETAVTDVVVRRGTAEAAAGSRLRRDRRRFRVHHHLRRGDEGRQELLCPGNGRGGGHRGPVAYRRRERLAGRRARHRRGRHH